MTMVGFNDKKLSLIHVKRFCKWIISCSAHQISQKLKFILLVQKKLYNWNTLGDAMENAFGKKAFRIKIPSLFSLW